MELKKILFVVTSHGEMGNTSRKTGIWIEEFAAPYYTFLDAGTEIVIASPKGGQSPIDPKSNEPENQTPATVRYYKDPDTIKRLSNTVKISSVSEKDFDTVFYPGGHGPMWDLPDNQDSIHLIESFNRAGKVMTLMCHSPVRRELAAFRYARWQVDHRPEPSVLGFSRDYGNRVVQTNEVI
jgi:hypothetical protein